MITRIKSDKIIVKNRLFNGFVYLKDGFIDEVSENERWADITYDFTGKYVSPGFIDIHTHGGGGYAFADSSSDEVIKGCDFHLKKGTTSILPTVSASAYSNMMKSLDNISKAMDSPIHKSNIIGAHLEGPYLSASQCGAQCPDFITPPIENDYKKAIELYGKYIKRWTYAPENDKNGEFCRYLTKNNIIPSAGHTDAKLSDMTFALNSGCRLVTHLYSCTSTVTRNKGYRSLGVIESTYLLDEIFAEIIADGSHLPPDLIKMIVKIKGIDKVILCTDSLSVAGSDITEGNMCGTDFIVEDGVAKLKSREAFAGSIATADKLIYVLVKKCGFSIPDSVKMLTENPAYLLGLNKGIIEKGRDADIAVFDDGISISDVFVGGKKVN